MSDVTVGTVWRWKPRNGTGVIQLADGTLAWFHFSAFDDETVPSVTEGMPVDVDVDHTPQGDFTCRAARIRRSLAIFLAALGVVARVRHRNPLPCPLDGSNSHSAGAGARPPKPTPHRVGLAVGSR